jgi:hypothetical protein
MEPQWTSSLVTDAHTIEPSASTDITRMSEREITVYGQQRQLVAGGENEIIAARKIMREGRTAKAPRTPPTENGHKPTAEPLPAAPDLVPIDFDRVEQAIDILHSRWTAVAYRAIQEADSVPMVKNAAL